MDRWTVLVFCSLIALPGCANVSLPDEGQGDPVATDPGTVTVVKQGDKWKATRTEAGSLAFASGSNVDASTVNGAITINAAGSQQAAITASLWATGSSEGEARQRLATLSLRLSGPGVEAHVKASDNAWSNKGGNLVIKLPTATVGDVLATATNGALSVKGLDADAVELGTTNAAVACDLTAGSLIIDATNGAIDCDGTFDDIDIETTNAAITLDVKAAASGKWSIESTNALIDVKVPENSQRGYDITAATTNGQITFGLDDTEDQGSSSTYVTQSRHERTRDYSSRAIQTQVDIDSTNASITVRS